MLLPGVTSPASLKLLFLRIAFTVCFFVMCAISCASTPASSPSLLIMPSAPRVMCTMPPGAANALTPSVSSTMNSHFRSGRVLACVITEPTRVTYFVTSWSW